MIISPLPVMANTQPQHLTGIDWNNPITRGLKLVVNPAAGAMNIVTGATLTFNGTVTRTAKGIGKAFGNTGSASNYLQAACSYGTDITVFALVQNSAGGSAQAYLDDDDTGASNRCFQFRQNSSNQVEFIRFNSSNSPFTATNTNTLSTTQLDTGYTAGGMCKGTSVYAWQGKQKSGAATLTGTAHTSTAPIRMLASKAGGGSNGLSGGIQLALLWDRCLSDEEYKSIVDNPWQIFRNQGTQAWIATLTGSVNGSGTGSLSALTLNVPTGSASGTSNASASGSVPTVTMSTPTGTSTGSGNSSGNVGSIQLGNVSGSASAGTGGNASGSISQVNTNAPTGVSSGWATVSSSLTTATLSSPSGVASGGIGATASGSIATSSLVAITASAVGNAQVSSSIATCTLAAPQGNASSGNSATGSGSIAQVVLGVMTASVNGYATMSGSIDNVNTSSVNGTSSGGANTSGSVPPISITAVLGTASGTSGGVVATGNIANVYVGVVNASVSASSVISSSLDSVLLVAPNGVASVGNLYVPRVLINIQAQPRTVKLKTEVRIVNIK